MQSHVGLPHVAEYPEPLPLYTYTSSLTTPGAILTLGRSGSRGEEFREIHLFQQDMNDLKGNHTSRLKNA